MTMPGLVGSNCIEWFSEHRAHHFHTWIGLSPTENLWDVLQKALHRLSELQYKILIKDLNLMTLQKLDKNSKYVLLSKLKAVQQKYFSVRPFFVPTLIWSGSVF